MASARKHMYGSVLGFYCVCHNCVRTSNRETTGIETGYRSIPRNTMGLGDSLSISNLCSSSCSSRILPSCCWRGR